MIYIALLSPTLQALTVENKGDNCQESLNSSRCNPGFQIKAFHLNSTQELNFNFRLLATGLLAHLTPVPYRLGHS